MKKQLVVCTALSALVLGTLGVSRAFEMPPPPAPFSGRMAQILELTTDQQTRIQAIFAADRETVKPLLEKRDGFRQQLHDAARAATFDEAAVRGLATGLAQVEVELCVLHTRGENAVNAVLTEEQRALAERLAPPMAGREHGGFPPPGEPG